MEIENYIKGLTLEQKRNLNSDINVQIREEVERESKLVKVTKIESGHYYFDSKYGSFEANRVAYKGRYRVWKRVQGVRGLKRGPIVAHEVDYEFDELKRAIAFNRFKE